jgi:hypothetical protein
MNEAGAYTEAELTCDLARCVVSTPKSLLQRDSTRDRKSRLQVSVDVTVDPYVRSGYHATGSGGC